MKTPVTELFGMKVYTDDAVYVGEIDDVVLNVDTKKVESLAVSNLNGDVGELKNHKGIKIPYRVVRAAKDIIIIRHVRGLFANENEEVI